MQNAKDKLVDSRAVAERFGVTRDCVRRWVREGRIPAVRASRRVVRFDLEAVEAALAVQRKAVFDE